MKKKRKRIEARHDLKIFTCPFQHWNVVELKGALWVPIQRQSTDLMTFWISKGKFSTKSNKKVEATLAQFEERGSLLRVETTHSPPPPFIMDFQSITQFSGML